MSTVLTKIRTQFEFKFNLNIWALQLYCMPVAFLLRLEGIVHVLIYFKLIFWTLQVVQACLFGCSDAHIYSHVYVSIHMLITWPNMFPTFPCPLEFVPFYFTLGYFCLATCLALNLSFFLFGNRGVDAAMLKATRAAVDCRWRLLVTSLGFCSTSRGCQRNWRPSVHLECQEGARLRCGPP